jgi:organic hydroperoxide reductase OsmC/OhrA
MTEHVHRFACHTTWIGAAKGPTSSYDSYSREMRVDVDGKPALAVSSTPVFRGDGAMHNPEELLVVALSTCHCLSYLALAARAGIEVVAYEDAASGVMEKMADRKVRFTSVALRPTVTLAKGADAATMERARALHQQAHEVCFIANSVNFPVSNDPQVVVVDQVVSATAARVR